MWTQVVTDADPSRARSRPNASLMFTQVVASEDQSRGQCGSKVVADVDPWPNSPWTMRISIVANLCKFVADAGPKSWPLWDQSRGRCVPMPWPIWPKSWPMLNQVVADVGHNVADVGHNVAEADLNCGR